MSAKLRNYQFALARELSEDFRKHRSICLQLPTGAGKTVVAGYISQQVIKSLDEGKSGAILYLAHRRELIHQVAKTLKDFGLGGMYGFIAAGHAEKPWEPIQIASLQTIARRINKLRMLKPRLIIVDEAHHARADSWHKVIDHFSESAILGLTATPARLDGKGLGAIFEKLVQGPTIKQLIEDGWLCELETYSVPVGLDMSGVKKMAGDYNRGETDKKVTGPVIASGVLNWQKYAQNRRTIHFAVSRRHSREFVKQMTEAGFSAEHVDGETPAGLRDQIMVRFATGKTQVISNCDLISEGYDCPECDCVIMARPTQSTTIFRQQAGRVMRPKSDGRKGIILDLAGNISVFGSVENEIEWSLEDGVIKESLSKSRTSTRTCKCGYAYPARLDQCPLCGAFADSRTAQEVAVELQKRDGVLPKQNQNGGTGIKKQVNREVFWTFGDKKKLVELQVKYGYRPGIVHHWQRIFGKKWAMLQANRK